MAAGRGVPKVLVTGASGYIASNTVLQLLAAGYEVRGTVRDPSNEKKTKFLRDLPGASERLSLVSGDLNDDKGWKEACEGMDYVLHMASPFVLEADESMVPTAVEGTKRVLGAAMDAKVKRVVVTSSFAAIGYGHPKSKIDFGPDVWSEETGHGPYTRSKVMAEKAAWALYEGKDDAPELAVINPAIVVGPMVAGSPHSFSSASLVKMALNREMPALPDWLFPYVDVRDVARAHIRAIQVPEAAGKRFLCCNPVPYNYREAAAELRRALPMYPIPTSNLPTWVVYLSSFIDASAAGLYPDLGRSFNLDTSNMDILGVKCRHPADGIVKLAKCVIQSGGVEKKEGYEEDPDTFSTVEDLDQIKL